MLKALISPLTAGLLLAGFAGSATAQDKTDVQALTKVSYLCERNVELNVVYINGLKNDESAAVLSVDGKLVPMRIWPAASGARYIALDEQDSYRWHTKGDEGMLTFLEADHTAKEQTLFSNCVNKDKAAQ
ncbi:MliC family protein [Pseudochrobactrum sp. sp1633]|uniref:MliC family protein n=1 Tax=Pseudochrobactrum sp. sp1633 TaxID=3036706 RepID=UPI0025A67E8C|nr:MliC family protein [Pseudochrobactrum sp. sp1633]MDM8344258.1 MliC family protein [Pseudochrobactrum sp. sp1633]HWD14609.1 MliC family protein [Pseudochrobactrum sp.]